MVPPYIAGRRAARTIDHKSSAIPVDNGRNVYDPVVGNVQLGLGRHSIGRISNEDLKGHENSQAAEEAAPVFMPGRWGGRQAETM